MLDKAISIAAQAFEGVHDKGGKPYILHCLWVMNNVRHLYDKPFGVDAMCAAVLHDIVEDTDWTYETLLEVGFSGFTINILNLLTRRDNESYEQFIKRIANAPNLDGEYARIIKLKDMEHNMKPNRLKGLTKKDFDRIEKYHRWYTYLSKI